MARHNPEAQTIIARDRTCNCGCQGQDPWHKRSYNRVIRDVVAVTPTINQGDSPVTTIVARGKASFPWGTEEVVDVRHTFKGKVWGLKPEWRLAKAKRNPRSPSKAGARTKRAIDKTSQAYQQRQAARGFGGYTKMDPCSACGKRRAVEPCIGIDEGGKCPESSKWVGDAICMPCINVERRKAGLHAVDVYGDPLASKAKRNPHRNPNEYTKAQYPYEVFYQRKVKGKITSGSVPIATREEAEACVRGMKRSPETVEAFIRKRNPSLLTLAVLGAGAYYLTKGGAKHPQQTRPAQRVRHWGAAPPIPTREPEASRPYLAWAYSKDTGWYENVPRASLEAAVAQGTRDAAAEDDPKFAVQQWLGNRWGTAKVYPRPAGGWQQRNPRRLVQNPYKDKILLPSGNIQYVYGEEDVAKRQREKAQRIEGFKNREEALLRAVKRDVAKGDDTALAIGLIMTTYERPGNAESAKDGHYGVTGWECRHLSKEGKSAVALDYVGKSGVQQHKVVSDPALVRALLARQRACKRRGERLLDTSPSSINRYLADYGVRAKDLRTFGANVEMQAELTRLRKAGPRLSSLKPRDLKRTLKAEFMAAVATVAGKMGHTTTMLRRQYLVKEMEPTYIATGRVVKSFA